MEHLDITVPKVEKMNIPNEIIGIIWYTRGVLNNLK